MLSNCLLLPSWMRACSRKIAGTSMSNAPSKHGLLEWCVQDHNRCTAKCCRSRAGLLLCRWAEAGDCQVRLSTPPCPHTILTSWTTGLQGKSLLHAQRVLCQLPYLHQAALCSETLARVGRRMGHQVLGHQASASGSCCHL